MLSHINTYNMESPKDDGVSLNGSSKFLGGENDQERFRTVTLDKENEFDPMNYPETAEYLKENSGNDLNHIEKDIGNDKTSGKKNGNKQNGRGKDEDNAVKKFESKIIDRKLTKRESKSNFT